MSRWQSDEIRRYQQDNDTAVEEQNRAARKQSRELAHVDDTVPPVETRFDEETFTREMYR